MDVERNSIVVWDPFVRVFHWSLVASYAVAWASAEEWDWLHEQSGYFILVLIGLRVMWGLVGTRHARFSDFVYGPGRVLAYLRDLTSGTPRHYLGHNPAGGWMVIALLVSLLLTGISGLKLYGVEGYGPLAVSGAGQEQGLVSQSDREITRAREEHEDDDDHDKYALRGEHDEEHEDEDDEFWEEIHEFFANFTVLLIGLHVAGVVLSSLRHGQNLVRAMVSGYKTTKHV